MSDINTDPVKALATLLSKFKTSHVHRWISKTDTFASTETRIIGIVTVLINMVLFVCIFFGFQNMYYTLEHMNNIMQGASGQDLAFSVLFTIFFAYMAGKSQVALTVFKIDKMFRDLTDSDDDNVTQKYIAVADEYIRMQKDSDGK